MNTIPNGDSKSSQQQNQINLLHPTAAIPTTTTATTTTTAASSASPPQYGEVPRVSGNSYLYPASHSIGNHPLSHIHHQQQQQQQQQQLQQLQQQQLKSQRFSNLQQDGQQSKLLYHPYPPQPLAYHSQDMYNPSQLQQHQTQHQQSEYAPNQLQSPEYVVHERQQQLQQQVQPHLGMASVPIPHYTIAADQYQHNRDALQQQQQQQHQWGGYTQHPQQSSSHPQPQQQQPQQPQQQQPQSTTQSYSQPVGKSPKQPKKPGRKPKKGSEEVDFTSTSAIPRTSPATSTSPPLTNSTESKTVTKRSRMGCLTCRHRKKRCCETRPRCTECSRLRLNCTWPKPGTEHKNKPKDQKEDENTIDHEIYGRIKVLRGIVEYRSLPKMSVETKSLRDRQISILERMLHLNKEGSADLTLASKSEEIIWKVLVMDEKSRDILSSVLRVNDLLRCGITVHALVNKRRSKLPDVPVIYFIEPTRENISIVIDDLNEDKYENFYINFTAHIDRDLLEDFAKQVALSGKANRIKQVWDQYLDFIVTEPNLFSLNISDIFTKFNTSRTSEEEIHQLVGKIADGILSLIITMDVVPIIRAQHNGPAEFVAQELDLKIREHISNSKSSGSGFDTNGSSLSQRPVIILLDRNFDLASMFAHSWIYQCMVSDVFQLKRNTIKLIKSGKNEGGGGGGGNEGSGETPVIKNYDIDPRDFFWNKYSQLPFPDVVENADLELNLYKQDAKEITNKTGISSLDDIDPNANATANIQQAVEKLPELTARKATLDMHMDILSCLINELQEKNLDTYFEIEQNASNNDAKNMKEFFELLQKDSTKDSSVDKLRTLIILTLVGNLSSENISKAKTTLKNKYPELNMDAFDYILQFKDNSKLTNLSSSSSLSLLNDSNNQKSYANSSTASHLNSSALLSGLSSKLYGLTEGKISEGISSIASRIKNFIPEKKLLPITNIVEAIMDPQNSSAQSVQLTDDYLYFDPKSRGGGHSKQPKRQSYEDSIVFVIGGGNYLEYQNLQERSHEPGKPTKNIIYGSTNILSSKEFLKECENLIK
ncbi:SLY1 [Candida oxycetoniae]|uniref:SLY1 n=1 Tax=Candida oxycetoniae TaxID=497107 RepID=A0AAI9WYS8_9ASCO|nr:SLY1 [Candida oxycetoniae]KAI3405453.2 SLY1 [Candida oxycetoniae]